jgi:hypothetical protein
VFGRQSDAATIVGCNSLIFSLTRQDIHVSDRLRTPADTK